MALNNYKITSHVYAQSHLYHFDQLQNCTAFPMHKQAFEKRRYLVRMTVRYMHTYVAAAFFT